MRLLDARIGKARQDPLTWAPTIVLRHGLRSSSNALDELEWYLRAHLPKARFHNQTYDWKQSVLLNGARLAAEIRTLPVSGPLLLVGHSMGGLVARVAVCALNDPLGFRSFVVGFASKLGYLESDVNKIKGLTLGSSPLKPVGIATLATPNSGAVLNGSRTTLGLVIPISSSWESVYDLTTERLFSFLQNFSISNAKVLTVSGSSTNRFNSHSGGTVGAIVRGIARLDRPHDSVVEDKSVNLFESVLPNELVHGGKNRIVHLRAYVACTQVTHSGIYDNAIVRHWLLEFFLRC